MINRRNFITGVTLAPLAGKARGQENDDAPQPPTSPASAASAPSAAASAASAPEAAASAPVAEVPVAPPAQAAPVITAETLFPLANGHVKFNLDELAEIIKSKGHEDWRLVAYTDPAHTPEKPIYDIGAGFNMSIPKDVTRGEPGDPYMFNGTIRKEPSSLTLWVAAGLPEAQFHQILSRVQDRVKEFGHAYKKNFPLFKTLHEDVSGPKDISDADAMKLLKISIRQAAYNARAYAKDWDTMTAKQQMGLTAIVYQIGANLEQFEKTLTALNGNKLLDMVRDSGNASQIRKAEQSHWQKVRTLFSQSKWAREHKSRASRVLGWLDPEADKTNSLVEAAQRIKSNVTGWSEKHKPSAKQGKGPVR